MKIKNVSQQDLKISILFGKETRVIPVKANQVMYCEDKAQVTKQLVIYEKKRLITLSKDVDKPDYVDFYKAFFELGTYIKSSAPTSIDLDDDVDDEQIDAEDIVVESISEVPSDEFSEDEEGGHAKRGRGRPKKPVDPNKSTSVKKQRGRPKGSTKDKQNTVTR